MPDRDQKWNSFKESKLDAHFDAFLTAKFELSRRVLTISSAAIGLVVSLALGFENPGPFLKWLVTGALVAFFVAVGATMQSLRVDPDYLIRSIEEIHYDEKSEKLENLNERTKCWGKVGLYSFAVGVLLLIISAIVTIFK